MKILIAFLVIVVLSTLTACGQDFDVEAEQETLQSIWEEINILIENMNTEVYEKYVAEDFEFYIAEKDWYGIGPRSYWWHWDEGTMITTDSVEWIITPDMAMAKSDKIIAPPGEKRVDYLIRDVFEKRDGQWYIVHRHSSEMLVRVD